MGELIVALILLALGFGLGRFLERKHYESIARREALLLHSPVVTFKNPPDDRSVESVSLAVGSVVVSVDYFKRFLAAFRMVFGGELRSYASLIDRGRREALLRMKESRPGADLFLNTRLETSSISKGSKNQRIGSVEILAYSTAVVYVDAVRPQTS